LLRGCEITNTLNEERLKIIPNEILIGIFGPKVGDNLGWKKECKEFSLLHIGSAV
jgi:hypothetical protein